MVEEKGGHWKYREWINKWKIQITLLVGVTLLALLCAFWNAAKMRTGLEYSTREYCKEITAQMGEGVNFGINSKMIELDNVADSISQAFDSSETAALEEFMMRKANILDFDALFLVNRQGEYVLQASTEKNETDIQKLDVLPSIEKSFQGEACVGFLEGQTLFYSAPVYMEKKSVYVLVGIRSKKIMQSFITSNAFDGNTISCIIDHRGGVILSPTDMNPFMELDSIFMNDSQSDVSEEIRQMQQNMRNGEAGTIRFTDINGDENLLAYNPLQINDWFLLTIVPADLISGSISIYTFRSFLIVGGTGLIFLVLLMLIYRLYSDNQKRLTRLAFEDSVTGGMNNAAFWMQYRSRTKEQDVLGCAVILLNVRHFKLFNAKFGFAAGNKVLRDIYEGIEAHLDKEKNEFATRAEMDHFFIFLKEYNKDRILTRIQEMEDTITFRLNEKFPRNQLSLAAGCYFVDDPTLDIRLIQDRAWIAAGDEMEINRTGCAFYNDSIAARIKKEQELDAMFEQSLANHEFQVYLQPKVNLDNRKIQGAEALVRWCHPEQGMISPGDFIPLFERNGKICQLDFYVFEEVCKFYQRRQEEGRPWYPVSVNLSRHHFYEEDFLDKFYAMHQAYHLPKYSIEFELTESMFFDQAHNERIKKGIDRMHQLGFRCSMDDFGSGYSSLGILKEFDVDTLKMDRSFFLDMDSEKAQDIIRSVVALTAKLQMETVAEGIEEIGQIEFLRSIRCDVVQGFFFSKPLPMEAFEKWVCQYEEGLSAQSENM